MLVFLQECIKIWRAFFSFPGIPSEIPTKKSIYFNIYFGYSFKSSSRFVLNFCIFIFFRFSLRIQKLLQGILSTDTFQSKSFKNSSRRISKFSSSVCFRISSLNPSRNLMRDLFKNSSSIVDCNSYTAICRTLQEILNIHEYT